MKKLIITGGHPTPALAVVDVIRQSYPEVTPIFVGRQHVNERETKDSYEYQEVTMRGVLFIDATFARGVWGLIRLPLAIMEGLRLIRAHRADAVLSFGGYIALPLAIAAFVARIPVYTHEQTAVSGTANRVIAWLAHKVFVSFPAADGLPGTRAIYTGNPVRELVVHPDMTGAQIYPPPLLVVSGGNLGSHSLNTHIFSIIPELVKVFTVVHQIGNVDEYKDGEVSSKLKSSLPIEYQDRYIPVAHLSTQVWGQTLSQASLLVGRSGANTFFELVALKLPCVLVPLPWSAHDEQRAHALMIQKAGAGEIFEQQEISAKLLELIMHVYTNRFTYVAGYRTLEGLYVSDAAFRITKEIIPS